MTMKTTTTDTIKDRIEIIESHLADDTLYREERDELETELFYLRDALARGWISNEHAEAVLIDYSTRDGYCDDRKWRRNVNLDLHASGKLEEHLPSTQHFGSRPRIITIEGKKFYSAV